MTKLKFRIDQKTPPKPLSDNERIVARLGELKLALEPYRGLVKEFEALKDQVKELHKSGSNGPWQSPGWLVTISPSSVAEYTVKAHTRYTVNIEQMQVAPTMQAAE